MIMTLLGVIGVVLLGGVLIWTLVDSHHWWVEQRKLAKRIDALEARKYPASRPDA